MDLLRSENTAGSVVVVVGGIPAVAWVALADY